MYYEIVIDFDYEHSDGKMRKVFDDFIKRRNANGIGLLRKDKIMLKLRFKDYGEVIREGLEKELEGVSIISLERLESEDQETLYHK